MGLRGPGAGRAKAARAKASGKKRRLPWKKKGLSRVERVIAFLEFLPITKGHLVGKRMRLIPEQRDFVARVYGRVGRERTKIAIKSEPKGQGKTGLTAGLALCHLLGPESVPRGEVYSASITRDKASLIFREMEAIILQVPEFAAPRTNIQRFHKKIEVLDGDGEGSTYESLSADARGGQGLAPSFWCYDELAQAKDGELVENLIASAGKQKACLGMILSTQAPSDDHPLSVLIDDAENDPAMVLDLRCAPVDADPFSEATIRACNPAIAGGYLDLDDILAEAERARRNPIFEARYRNLRLNQRIDTNVDARIVPAAVWRDCSAEIDMRRLQGRRCFGGLDLSGKHDLTAFVLAFPDVGKEPGFDLLSFFWTPEDRMAERTDRERALFRMWIDAGHMTAVPGPVIKYRYMAAQLADLARRFDIESIGYDRWRIDDFKVDLAEEGVELPLEPYGQGFRDISPAVEYFAELALSGRLRHSGNPALNAAVTSAIMVADAAGNLKVDKDKSNKRSTCRIDGLLAALMALGTAKRFEANRPVEPRYQMMVI